MIINTIIITISIRNSNIEFLCLKKFIWTYFHLEKKNLYSLRKKNYFHLEKKNLFSLRKKNFRIGIQIRI